MVIELQRQTRVSDLGYGLEVTDWGFGIGKSTWSNRLGLSTWSNRSEFQIRVMAVVVDLEKLIAISVDSVFHVVMKMPKRSNVVFSVLTTSDCGATWNHDYVHTESSA